MTMILRVDRTERDGARIVICLELLDKGEDVAMIFAQELSETCATVFRMNLAAE